MQVLDALSRGDTQATVEVSHRSANDELARIAEAVNTFRTQTLALRRHRRRALRRQRQQERFIRSEMTRLSTNLNEEERNDILQDLAEIEAPAGAAANDQGETPAEEDSAGDLQVMGFAFQKMTDRVGRQQERLRTLVAELQEALRTQTAYMALQHDLQIATRVQRSFLPGEQLDTEGAHIHATMHTAREVGGDFYDFFPLDEDRVGIVIGDVVGQGRARIAVHGGYPYRDPGHRPLRGGRTRQVPANGQRDAGRRVPFRRVRDRVLRHLRPP